MKLTIDDEWSVEMQDEKIHLISLHKDPQQQWGGTRWGSALAAQTVMVGVYTTIAEQMYANMDFDNALPKKAKCPAAGQGISFASVYCPSLLQYDSVVYNNTTSCAG